MTRDTRIALFLMAEQSRKAACLRAKELSDLFEHHWRWSKKTVFVRLCLELDRAAHEPRRGANTARADQLKTDQPLARTSDNDDHGLLTGPKCVRVNMPAEMNFGES